MAYGELYIEPIRPTTNPKNGQFLKGHIPFNKGKKWSEWLDGRKAKRILKNLKHTGNPDLPGCNRKAVVAIDKEGTFCVFPSSMAASKALNVNSRNIRSVCSKRRKTAGGFLFFWETDPEWPNHIKRQN